MMQRYYTYTNALFVILLYLASFLINVPISIRVPIENIIDILVAPTFYILRITTIVVFVGALIFFIVIIVFHISFVLDF